MPTVADHTALTSGISWNGMDNAPSYGQSVILTFAFAEAPNPNHRFSLADANYFRSLDGGERQMFRDALSAWASVSGITFVEASAGYGDIEVGVYDLTIKGQASYPHVPYGVIDGVPTLYGETTTASFGDVALDFREGVNMQFMLHELGHALGLKHPHEGEVQLVGSLDHRSNTVMSYNGERRMELSPLDVPAIQAIYGADTADGSHVTQWGWDAATNTLTQIGSAADEFLFGTAANDLVVGNGGNDLISTRAGNDTIQVAGRAFQVSGGEGVDTLVVDFASGDVEVYGGGAYWYAGDDMKAFGIERFAFTDGTVAFDIAGNAGQAYRVYQAAFARTPDNDGLKFWIGEMDAGLSLAAVASGFVTSEEFQRVYGASVSNEIFVDRLYENILGRDGETSGFNFWVNELNSGVSDKASVLAGFSESQENIARVAPALDDGIWYT